MRVEPERVAWIVGGVFLLLSLLGWWLEPAMFPHAWLAALIMWIGWPLGCLALLLVHVLTGGRWGEVIRPYLFAGIGTLPLLLPALVPLLMESSRLYPWLQPSVVNGLANHFYLNLSFAASRTFGYLIIWFAIAALSLRAVRRGGPGAPLAVIGLILLGVTVTFAAIDATMSLDPQFVSSAYGMIAGAESGLVALSICVLAAALDTSLPTEALDDLGKLLLALLVLWAYLDFMQFLIVWQSDLPHEAHWYIVRSTHGWGTLAGLVAVGHFLLPFFALMSPALRHSRRGIGGVAALLITMEVLRAWWIVLPAAHRGISWLDIASMLAVGGLSAGLALHGPHLRAGAVQVHHG